MAVVILSNDHARRFSDGVQKIEVSGKNVRQVTADLNQRFPGLSAELANGFAVAIDGVIYSEPFLEPVGPDSEVCFLPPISGG
jgi:molybdopterin converting factor small subunit